MDKNANNSSYINLLSEFGEKKIQCRFEAMKEDLYNLLVKYKIDDCCKININLLEDTISDFFEDIFRLKKGHGIDYTQEEKIYSYMVCWGIRNRPIQVVDSQKFSEIIEKNESEFGSIARHLLHVNEFIFTMWLITQIAAELNSRLKTKIQIDDFMTKFKGHKSVCDITEKLYYHFRYRTHTPKTVLLVVESIFAMADFMIEII